MKIMTYEQFKGEDNQATLDFDRELDNTVLDIIRDVRENKDNALFRYAEKFDHTTLDALRVTEEEYKEASQHVSDEFKRAIEKAAENISEFHQAQKEKSWFFDRDDEIMLGQKVTPIDK